MTELSEWIVDNKLSLLNSELEDVFKIEGVGKFLLIEYKKKMFTDKFELILSPAEKAMEDLTDFYLFKFGGKYYYTPIKTEKNPEVNPFKYLGKCVQEIEQPFSYLGIHSEYDICNGSRKFPDWIKKAKFYGYDTVGICDKNTLAGVLQLQFQCQKENIKFVIGESINIVRKGENANIKIYVLNNQGWKNLLRLNCIINVQKRGVTIDDLIQYSSGLVLILCDNLFFSDLPILKRNFEKVFYQIDTVVWERDEKDKESLLVLKEYFDRYINLVEPILINDSYYLDKGDGYIKKILNKIGDVGFQHESKNQYFKNLDDNFEILSSLFSDKKKVLEIFTEASSNTNWVSNNVDFRIEKKLHLPKFKCENSEELFFNLIQKGVEEKLSKEQDLEKYYERIEKEVDVIIRGGFIDYFLILWDVIEFCKKENIYVGIGRGSASGSLISYLLGIIKINPFDYDLIFERFLNEARIKEGCPDIDIDIEAGKRDVVKQYLVQKYGYNHICYVGNNNTFQLKAALKDLASVYGYPASVVFNFKDVKTKPEETDTFIDVFKNTIKNPVFTDFIRKNFELINAIQLIISQVRNKSVHASAMIIFPEHDGDDNFMEIFDWIPVRMEDGNLVSEWKGSDLDKIGFLKEDLLSLEQLDKFKEITELVKKTTGEEINVFNLEYNDKGVYKLFQKGFNQDIHHFGSTGLIGYSLNVKPDNMEHLISMISLYRPGTMISNAHIDYINLRHGRKNTEYDLEVLKEVTENTYGLYIYQEQAIKVTQILSDFSFSEGDEIRKAMGKKIQSLLDSYKQLFIDRAIENGYEEKIVKKIWNKLQAFAGYSFNRSHAVAYAITGYIGQWLKYKYPIQFWTVALEYAKESNISKLICEINKIGDFIKVLPPDINYSRQSFYTDFEQAKIYWSLSKIKNVGDIAVSIIVEEREKNGDFYSLKEFYERVPKSKVNKRVVESLIFSGCFDNIESIKTPQERLSLIEKYRKIVGIKIDKGKDTFTDNNRIDEEYWWILRQKELCGFGYLNYKRVILKFSIIFKQSANKLIDPIEFYSEFNSRGNKRGIIAGVISGFIERNSKNGKFAQIQIECNDEMIWVVCWPITWADYGKQLSLAKGKLLIIDGKIGYDDYKNMNVLYTEDNSQVEILN